MGRPARYCSLPPDTFSDWVRAGLGHLAWETGTGEGRPGGVGLDPWGCPGSRGDLPLRLSSSRPDVGHTALLVVIAAWGGVGVLEGAGWAGLATVLGSRPLHPRRRRGGVVGGHSLVGPLIPGSHPGEERLAACPRPPTPCRGLTVSQSSCKASPGWHSKPLANWGTPDDLGAAIHEQMHEQGKN